MNDNGNYLVMVMSYQYNGSVVKVFFKYSRSIIYFLGTATVKEDVGQYHYDDGTQHCN